MTTGLVYDERFLAHRAPYDHPEHPGRLEAIVRRIRDEGLDERCRRVPAREITPEELERVHTLSHIGAIEETAAEDFLQLDPDTYTCRDSALAARLAAGGLTDLTLDVLRGDCDNGLALLRPPGHHAEANRAMGFCLYNNVAVAARAVQAAGAARTSPDRRLGSPPRQRHAAHVPGGPFGPVLLDPSVPVLPGNRRGRRDRGGAGRGFTVNVPWPGGMGDAEYLAAFDRVLLPIARDFAPDLTLVSAGFDAAEGDPLGSMRLSPAGYAAMTSRLLTLSNGRVVLALEGGYNLDAISRSAAACLRVLLGEKPPAADPAEPRPTALRVIESVLKARGPAS